MKKRVAIIMMTAGPALMMGCGGSSSNDPAPPQGPASPLANALPAGFTQHSVQAYTAVERGDGTSASTQDLLTAGLGKTGLGTVTAPAYADPLNPTALELRRNAIHANYRAILDPSEAGGYGRLYGPNIDSAGNDTRGEGLVPGKEYLAVLDDGSGRKQVVVAVQIPNSFDVNNPCVVAGPSSGSRGVYGSMGSAAEWGLKKGCAVALTDAGKGVGLHDLMDDTVNRVDGTRATRSTAQNFSTFAANLTAEARNNFNSLFPNRVALKHAHSQVNPEKDWGNDTLASIRYALYALNEEHGEALPGNAGKSVRFTPENTLVIAGSVSNGGTAVLQAAERDSTGLIDGVVASEPNAQPATQAGYGVQFGGVSVPVVGLPLIDYFTFANLYQPCAALAPGARLIENSGYNYMGVFGMNQRALNRCEALASKGLVAGTTLEERATDALQRLRAYGFSAENDTMHNAHYGLGNTAVISMMYTNALGRFSVADNLCGMSMAPVAGFGGELAPLSAQAKAQSFTANGTAGGTPVSVFYNDSVGGARSWAFGVSPSTGLADFSLDAALCQRALVTGEDPVTRQALTASTTPTLAQSQRVRAGMAEVLLNGNLRGKPTLIVTGRSDALLPVNHASRAYTAFNQSVEGSASQLRYIEVTNAQHFDTFLSLFNGFDNRFVPLHGYFNQAMDAMYQHLRSGAALPPSQVIRTTPRGGAINAAPPLQASQLPDIAFEPVAGNRIGLGAGNTLQVPE